jgi:hypothetical protein
MSVRSILGHAVVYGVVVTTALHHELPGQATVPGMRGEWGLKSGSQMAPGAYLGLIYDWYAPDRVIDRDGNALTRFGLNQHAFGLFPAWVSSSRIWNNTTQWGFYAAIPVANAAISAANVDLRTGWGFSDIYVQPVYLGWTLPMADITTGMGVTMPTGRYSNGARDNTGLGMWSLAFDAGTTVYGGAKKEWNTSALATFQMQSSVEGSDKRPGNVLSLEGGFGYAVLKGFGNVGAAYYAQWKVSDDRNFPVLKIPRLNAHDEYYAIGPEITAPIAVKPLPVILTARYFFEMGNRVATQGNQLLVFLTLAKSSARAP